MLAEHAAVADAVVLDVGADLVGDRRATSRARSSVAAELGQLGGAIERHPAHQLRRDVVLRRAACLPDALVGLPPDGGRALGLRLDERPEPAGEALAAPGVEEDRVEGGAEDVVLALIERAVADPDRAGAGVAAQVVERRLGQVAPAVDPVHDLQGAVVVDLEVGDELHELVGFPVEVQPVQRLQRERGVAHPAVAVVPVPFAAGRLGQRRGQRGDGRAGRHVGESLDGERGALDRVAATDGPGSGPCRASPARTRPWSSTRCVGVVDVLRSGQVGGPRQRAEDPVAGPQRAPGPHPPALGADGHVGVQAQRHAGTVRVGGVPGAVDHRPRRRHARRSRRPARTRAPSRPGRRCTRPCGRGGARRPSSAGGRVCGVTASGPRVGPIVSASLTTTQPDGVFHVVTRTFVPAS